MNRDIRITYMIHLVYKLSKMHRTEVKLEPTAQQAQVFGLLNNYRKQLKLNTTMRVAGGWVRDKILQKESHDIDITLDDMKGEQFVLLLQKYSQNKNQKITGFGVTRLNPLMSKHLETATAKIFGYSIDFVNLRSETYSEGSRIPIIEQGTPLLDAMRRDFTVNALFYNLQTEQVQDYTERGIADLKEGILRTPLDPYQTFKDDPLRVLRCFRFKAKFGFTIDPLIYDTLINDKENTIHQALQNKVSKERRGIQMAGILKVPAPLQSLHEILRFGFWKLIFQVPKQSTNSLTEAPQVSFNCIKEGIASLQLFGFTTQKEIQLRQQLSESELLLCIRLSFIMLPYYYATVKINKSSCPLIEHIVKNQLKYPAKTCKFVNKVSELREALENIISKDYHQENILPKLVRWLLNAEQKWELALHCVKAHRSAVGKQQHHLQPFEVREIIYKYKIHDCYLRHSFIDGNFLTKRGKKGPIIKVILDNAKIHQTLNQQLSSEQFFQYYTNNQAFFQAPSTYN